MLVVGAGGVGSFVGGALVRAGYDVTFYGRGPHFDAIAAQGLDVSSARGTFHVSVATLDDLENSPDFGVILLAVKAHQIEPLAGRLGALARAGSTIVTLQNGVPFWYFDGFGGRLEGARLQSVDPGGTIAAAIDANSVIACVVNAGNRVPRPGTVEHVGDAAYALGTPSGKLTPQVHDLVDALTCAGLDPVADINVRYTIWNKVVGNATLNPVSALTRATAQEIVDDEAIVGLMRDSMEEQLATGRALGFEMPASAEAWVAATRRYGDQRTSMLQDLEAGRALELEPIAGAAIEIAGLLGIEVPATRRLYALTRLLDGTSRRAGEA